MSAGNGRIFISYRRQETAWPARQLYEVLVARFGSEAVFKDVDDIEPGEDFVDRITEAVAACDFLLALIGPQWLTMTDATGARRLDDPEDFVRLELSAALSRGVRVVPILVDGARMPRADELPPDLAAVTRRQAVEISPVGFNTDRLLATLAAALARPGEPQSGQPAATPDAPRPTEAPRSPSTAAERPSPSPMPAAPQPSGDAGTGSLPVTQQPEQTGEGDAGSSDLTQTPSPAGAVAQPPQETGQGVPGSSTFTQPPQQTGDGHAGLSDFAQRPAQPGADAQPPQQTDQGNATSSDFARPTAPTAAGMRAGAPLTSARPGAGAGSPQQAGTAARPSEHQPDKDGAGDDVPGGSAGQSPNRRLPLVVGVAALVLAVVAGLVIWRPWSSQQGSSGETPTAAQTGATTVPSTSSPSPSPVDSGGSASLDLPQPPILAHRGGFEHHQLETMQAMEAAAREGFAVETDVRYTKDGVAVLVHDEAATRGLDCDGKDVRVSQTTWAKLKETCRSKPNAEDRNTYQIPTLNATLEALAAAHPSAWVFLEVKTDESDAKLKQLLATPAEFGLSERTVFTAFSRDRLNRIKKIDPSFRRVLFVQSERVSAEALARDDLWGVAVKADIADAEYVKSLQERGLKVVIWNVNDPKQWAALLKFGADALMTDVPEKYRAWLANR